MKNNAQPKVTTAGYPLGRGYGHDYMRGGEVFGGYGYSEREEYDMPRGLLNEGDGSVTEGRSRTRSSTADES